MLDQASRHHDFIDFPALMEKAAWYTADLLKTLALIETHGRRIFCTYSQFNLPYAQCAGVIEQKVEHRDRMPAATLRATHVDHDDGGAMRHLASLLPHQPHHPDRLQALKLTTTELLV